MKAVVGSVEAGTNLRMQHDFHLVISDADRRFIAAVAAMQGWLAGRGNAPVSRESQQILAEASVACVDALLAELGEGGT